MTPAVTALRRAGVAYELREYAHDPDARAYGVEAAEKLGLDPALVFKTLIVALDGGALGCAVIPVAAMLDLKRCARALGAKRAALAERAAAERATGYVVGGISPLGQKRRLPMVIDSSAARHATIYVSGGRRGLDIALAPDALVRLTGARSAAVTTPGD